MIRRKVRSRLSGLLNRIPDYNWELNYFPEFLRQGAVSWPLLISVEIVASFFINSGFDFGGSASLFVSGTTFYSIVAGLWINPKLRDRIF